MSHLRPFGDNPHKGYLGADVPTIIARLEELISEEEERGDIGAFKNGTPRERRLNRAYDALDALHSIDNTHP